MFGLGHEDRAFQKGKWRAKKKVAKVGEKGLGQNGDNISCFSIVANIWEKKICDIMVFTVFWVFVTLKIVGDIRGYLYILVIFYCQKSTF